MALGRRCELRACVLCFVSSVAEDAMGEIERVVEVLEFVSYVRFEWVR